MGFNGFFSIIFILFTIVLVVCGWITKKWVSGSNDYFIAGREVGVLNNIFGVAAIGFAGTIITLGPGLAIQSGFWGSYGFGMAYLFGGLALYGLLFAPYIRRSGAHTLPEWLEMRFDSKTRILITLSSIFGLLGIMANNVLSMALVTTGFTGWSLIATLSAIFLMFLIFTYVGGFWAISMTDFIQMCIGLVALPAMLIGLMTNYGGFSFISNNWPGDLSYLTSGITNGSLPLFSLQYPSLLTFIILFACFLVWGNNYYWLRVSSTRSESTAKKSFVYAAIILAVGPYLILTLSGLYAGTAFADTFAPNGDVSPMSAFGVVLKGLPIAIAAFALLGALAASISTSTTSLIGASSTATRDIYQKYYRPNATPKELTVPSKIITMVLGLLVWVLCFYPGGPLFLFAFSTAWLGPPSVLVLLGIWWKRTTMAGAFTGAVVGIGLTTLFTILELTNIFVLSQYTHIGVVGLITTILATVIVSLLTTPNYYGQSDWQNNGNHTTTYQLDEKELEVLTLIANGYNTMAEVSDMLGVDSAVSNKIIEKLDQNKIIYRKKYSGPGFYTFYISEAGQKLVKHDETYDTVAQLSREDVMFLKEIEKGTDNFKTFIQTNEYDSLKVSVILSKFIRQGYLHESGIWRRKVKLNESGQNYLNSIKATTA
ncbi:sodium:solute symporter family transporter [Piscibacillus salipiscarius]|uniref:Sodium:solute symporter n=1 Tax=Piscibacillus salipiscarius TaxID=299480 RepID=A0ABW5QDX4_9BACI